MAIMAKQVVSTDKAQSLPVFSQGIIHNGVVYCSGQIGIDPAMNKLVEGDIKARARQILTNLSNVLESAGSKLENIIKVNIFLTDMANFQAVNEVYVEMMPQPMPARTCVAVHQLPFYTDIEIECSAFIDGKSE